jgi:hypothetical protein
MERPASVTVIAALFFLVAGYLVTTALLSWWRLARFRGRWERGSRTEEN